MTTEHSKPITPNPLFDTSADQAMPPIKRVVAWMVRATIISLFVAIIATVVVFTGYGETGEQGAPWIDVVTSLAGVSWGMVMLLLLVLPVPLFMSIRDQRRRKAMADDA